MEIVNMSKRSQSLRDEKCQIKATREFSMNDNETFATQGKLLLAPIRQYSQVQQNNCPCILLQQESKKRTMVYYKDTTCAKTAF